MSKSLESALHNLVKQRLDASDISYCGITKNGYQIPVLLHKSAYNFTGDCNRMLIIGGINGTNGAVQLILDVIGTVTNHSNGFNTLSISYIPYLDYDAYISNPQTSQAEGKLTHGFPPDKNYFFDAEIPESRYIWRWISYQAPDLVLELALGESMQVVSNEAALDFAADMNVVGSISDDSLIGALGRKHESNPGPIPGVRITGTYEQVISKTVELLHKVVDSGHTNQSLSNSAVAAIRKRTGRTAQGVSEALASQFGYKLDSPINYIQGVGVSGRIRLAEYKNQDVPDDIFQLVDPYVDNPSTSFGDSPGSASLAGAVWADDLFRVTKDARYKNYLLDLANRFDLSGSLPPPRQRIRNGEQRICSCLDQ